MNKYKLSIRIIVGVVLFTVISCNDKEKDKLYDELIAGYKTSNETLEDNTVRAYTSLRFKSERPESRTVALIWFMKATIIKNKSDSIIECLDSLIIKLKEINHKESIITKDKSEVLYKQLIDFKQQILTVDPEQQTMFKDSLSITSNAIDTLEKAERTFYEDYFLIKGNDVKKQIVHLTKLENNIRFLESTLIVFMSRKSCVMGCNFSIDHAMISQNTFHLKKNEVLEITAGIGAFRAATGGHVLFNNKVIPIKGEGYAVDRKTITEQPGKYKLPLRIEYKKPDGTTSYFETEIKYTVDE